MAEAQSSVEAFNISVIAYFHRLLINIIILLVASKHEIPTASQYINTGAGIWVYRLFNIFEIQYNYNLFGYTTIHLV